MDFERQSLLERRGYKVRTYERVTPPAGDDSATDNVWPKVQAPVQPDGSDYQSFEAVYFPNGTPVRPYQPDGITPNPIDVQWDYAWEHYARKGAKGGALYETKINKKG